MKQNEKNKIIKIKTKELEFILPKQLYAREPSEFRNFERKNSRMMVGYKYTEKIIDSSVNEIDQFLESGDLLILNDSLTIPPIVEVYNKDIGYFLLILNNKKNFLNQWYATLDILKDDYVILNEGDELLLDNSLIRFKILNKYNNKVLIESNVSEEELHTYLLKNGIPIKSAYVKNNYDISIYQNEIGKKYGSFENPAANRHFTTSLLNKLENKGVNIAYITLHCSSGSAFIKESELSQHTVEKEYYSVPERTQNLIYKIKVNGGRIIAIGTTSARTVESVEYSEDFKVRNKISGFTDLAIYPGYNFKILDGVVTNFHGPRSSRLAFASAFIGINNIMKLYKKAIEKDYKFYEFGDTTLLIINDLKGGE